MNSTCKVVLFADDTTVVYIINRCSLKQTGNHIFNSVINCSFVNGLTLNSDETHTIRFRFFNFY